MKKIVTIIGPTASGKTNLAIELAKRCNGEIVGLDSRQIYKGMYIGTPQPTKKEMDGVTHHLIGFRNPSEPISAGEFSSMVSAKINEIKKKIKEQLFVVVQVFTFVHYQEVYSMEVYQT